MRLIRAASAGTSRHSRFDHVGNMATMGWRAWRLKDPQQYLLFLLFRPTAVPSIEMAAHRLKISGVSTLPLPSYAARFGQRPNPFAKVSS